MIIIDLGAVSYSQAPSIANNTSVAYDSSKNFIVFYIICYTNHNFSYL